MADPWTGVSVSSPGIRLEIWCDEDGCAFRLEPDWHGEADASVEAAGHVRETGHRVLASECDLWVYEPEELADLT